MTPKEKAKELFDKIDREVSKGSYDGWYDKRISIQCALIVVDEILLNDLCNDGFEVDQERAIIICGSFWQQVRQEIELLKE